MNTWEITKDQAPEKDPPCFYLTTDYIFYVYLYIIWELHLTVLVDVNIIQYLVKLVETNSFAITLNNSEELSQQ